MSTVGYSMRLLLPSIVLAVLAVIAADASCGQNCPGLNFIKEGYIFASKPGTYITSYPIVGRGGSGCCACKTKCLNWGSNCTAVECAPWAGAWLDYDGVTYVNCQLYSGTSETPEMSSGDPAFPTWESLC